MVDSGGLWSGVEWTRWTRWTRWIRYRWSGLLDILLLGLRVESSRWIVLFLALSWAICSAAWASHPTRYGILQVARLSEHYVLGGVSIELLDHRSALFLVKMNGLLHGVEVDLVPLFEVEEDAVLTGLVQRVWGIRLRFIVRVGHRGGESGVRLNDFRVHSPQKSTEVHKSPPHSGGLYALFMRKVHI